MKDFKKYWDKKAQKQRKTWESKLARRREHHTPVEEIQQDVFKPFNRRPKFDEFFADLRQSHYITKNPLTEWQSGNIRFSEDALCEAILQRGGHLDEFRMKKEHAVTDKGHYTDLDTFTLTYGAATMIIKRFSTKDVPFGYYEVTPCTRFDDNCPMRMEETGFYTLDIASLLMEMDGECRLREEEFKYYAKELRLASVEGAVADDIEFKLCDDSQIPAKVKIAINRSPYFDEYHSVRAVLVPWMKASKEFMENITQADKNKEGMLFSAYARDSWTSSFIDIKGYVAKVFLPYLASQGLSDATVDLIGSKMLITYKGYKMLIMPSSAYQGEYKCFVYPYLEETDSIWEEICEHQHRWTDDNILCISFNFLTLSAIARYLKLMSKYKDQIYHVKAKAIEAHKSIKGE